MSKKESAPKEKHSPLPWSMRDLIYHDEPNKYALVFRSGFVNGFEMKRVDRGGRFSEPDATLIVRAVNRTPAFEAMKAALEGLLKARNPSDGWNEARAALALAQDSKGGEVGL